MRVEETALPGVVVVHPDVFEDERGFLLENYSKQRYDAFPALRWDFVQDNHSRSAHGVLRGLHFQERQPQGKLVCASQGRIYDVALDIDPQSPTFGQHVGIHLDDREHQQIFIPPGYAHGFCVLSDVADVQYKTTAHYLPGDGKGIRWNDPALGIAWPIASPIVSAADAANPTLEEYLRR